METTHLDVGVLEMMLSKAKELALKAKGNSMGSIGDWLNPENTCSILHIKQSTLRSLRISGKLPYSQIGSKFFYHKDDITKLIGNQIIETNI